MNKKVNRDVNKKTNNILQSKMGCDRKERKKNRNK